MDNLCNICLSQDRKLNSRDDLIPVLQYLTPELNNLVSTLNICWECEALLKKCCSLRSQILKAHAVHNSLNVRHEIEVEPATDLENQKSLSSLNTKHISNYDFIFNHSHTATSDEPCLETHNNVPIQPNMIYRDIARSSSSVEVNASSSTLAVSDEVDEENEPVSDQEPSSTVENAGATVWSGCINMVDVARFYVSAHEVSGITTNLEEELSAELDVVGRVNPVLVWDYIDKMRKTGSKDIVVLRLQAANDEAKMQYIALYSYLNSRKRLGVVKVVNASSVKDIYIVPLSASACVPPVLLPLEGPGLPETRSHLLLGVVVRQRKNTPQLRTPSEITSPKVTRSSRKRSFTPPPAAIPNVQTYASPALSTTVEDTIAASLGEDFIETEYVECDVIIKIEHDSDENPDNSDNNSDNSDDNFDKSDSDDPSKTSKGVKRSLQSKNYLNKKVKVANVKYTKDDFKRRLKCSDTKYDKTTRSLPPILMGIDDIKKSNQSMDLNDISHRLASNLDSKEFVVNCINSLNSEKFPFVKFKPVEFSIPSDDEILNYFIESMKKALIFEDDVENVTISLLSLEEAKRRRNKQAAKDYTYKNSKFKCGKCLRGYATKRELDEHIRNKHVQDDRQKTELCPICKCFIDKSLFMFHYGRHRVCYTCTQCQKESAEITEMRIHLEEHYDKSDEPKEKYCYLCYREFKNNYNLRVHNNLRHEAPMILKKSDKSRQYICPEPHCELKFILSSKLKQHIRHEHEQLADYKCHICNKMLNSNIGLKRHISRFHKTKKKAK